MSNTTEAANDLIEKLNTYNLHMSNYSQSKASEWTNQEIAQALKLIELEKLSKKEMQFIATWNTKITKDSPEYTVFEELRSRFATSLSLTRTVIKTIKLAVKQFNDAIKIQENYLLKASAYVEEDNKKPRNYSLYDFLKE